MVEIRTEIDIDATPEAVWDVLADFDAYPEWNPLVRQLEGERRLGSRLRARFVGPGGREIRARVTLTHFTRAERIGWRGRPLPGLMEGEHVYTLEPRAGGGVHLRNEESFQGLLVPLARRWILSAAPGYDANNRALKERVERKAGG